MVVDATDPTLKKFNKGTERYGHEFDASLCGHVRNSDMFHSNTLQSFTLCTELQTNVVYTMITHTPFCLKTGFLQVLTPLSVTFVRRRRGMPLSPPSADECWMSPIEGFHPATHKSVPRCAQSSTPLLLRWFVCFRA